MIGIFGGGFDPIHNGHLACINYGLSFLGLTQLQLLPYQQSPHKNTCYFSNADRLAMLDLIKKNINSDKLVVNVREIEDIDSTSYTIDTLKKMSKTEPICLLMGMDSFLSMASWKDYLELAQHCNLVVFRRPSYELKDKNLLNFSHVDDIEELKNKQRGGVLFVKQTSVGLSSSEIRQQINDKIPANATYSDWYRIFSSQLPNSVITFLAHHDRQKN